MNPHAHALANHIAPVLAMHEAYAAELLGDLSETQLDHVPGPGHENTPRFTIGHLCTGSALTRWAVENPTGAKPDSLDVPAHFDVFRRMGPADRRTPEPEDGAPDRAALLTEFQRQHALLESCVRSAPDETLAMDRPWKLGHLMPSVADIVMFVCAHEALHLGQLASWRRACDLPAAMARMCKDPPPRS